LVPLGRQLLACIRAPVASAQLGQPRELPNHRETDVHNAKLHREYLFL